MVRGRGCVDLEAVRLPDVDAHRRCERLNRWISRTLHLPVARRVPRPSFSHRTWLAHALLA